MFNANLIKELKLKISLFFRRKKADGNVGIYDGGKGTKINNNVIRGFGTGIKEKGKNAEIERNKIIK